MRWNSLKSERLKKTRGVSFEEILNSKWVATIQHPKRENQQVFVYEYKEYLWAVPYVEEGDTIFLKTIYPSRKLTGIYKKR
jgi:uncharacterized DUF497 family protein